MPKKLRAVEVITDKLWITYDNKGNKSGTLSGNSNSFTWLKVDGSKVDLTSSESLLVFEFEHKNTLSSWHQEYVFGYPVLQTATFNAQEKDNLPCFTKTETSTILFAAGYYGINFDNGGWLDACCPKFTTLCKYEYMGPFKTEVDVQIAIKRKVRTDT
jgi:hypothetical protein